MDTGIQVEDREGLLPMLIAKQPVGLTEWLGGGERIGDVVPQLLHFIQYQQVLPRQGVGVLVGKVALVGLSEELVLQLDQPENVRVFCERLIAGHHLTPFVLSGWVWQEQDICEPFVSFPWCDVDKAAIRALPDGMKFCFKPDVFCDVDAPADHLFATFSSNLLWHDRETFFRWLSGHGLVGDVKRRLSGGDAVAEL